MMKMTEREVESLLYLSVKKSAWRMVPPETDPELANFVQIGLLAWEGPEIGYRITEAGRIALREGETT